MLKADEIREIRGDQRDLQDRAVFDTENMPPKAVAYLTAYRAAANMAENMLFHAELQLRRYEQEERHHGQTG